MTQPNYKYDVTATNTPGGVEVKIEMEDVGDGVAKSVELGEFPDHQQAADAAATWVATDLGCFAQLLGGRRK